MDFEVPDYLSPEQKLQETEVLTLCFNLRRDERSRYGQQAKKLLASKFFVSKSGIYDLTYSIRGDRFICDANPQLPLIDSFSIEAPMPEIQAAQIETLIELFAQSEAGLIS